MFYKKRRDALFHIMPDEYLMKSDKSRGREQDFDKLIN